MLGPLDFSVLSGVPGQMDHPLVRDAQQRIAEVARRTGKHWACPGASPDETQRLLDMGARVIFHYADIVAVKTALERIQRDFAPLGFTFDNRLAVPGEADGGSD